MTRWSESRRSWAPAAIHAYRSVLTMIFEGKGKSKKLRFPLRISSAIVAQSRALNTLG